MVGSKTPTYPRSTAGENNLPKGRNFPHKILPFTPKIGVWKVEGGYELYKLIIIRMKNKTFSLKAQLINVTTGNDFQIWLNESQAFKFGITAVDNVILSYEKDGKHKRLSVNVDLTNDFLES